MQDARGDIRNQEATPLSEQVDQVNEFVKCHTVQCCNMSQFQDRPRPIVI